MAWIVSITDKKQEQDKVRVYLQLVNGSHTLFTDVVVGSKDELKRVVKNKIRALNETTTLDDVLVGDSFDVSDPAPTVDETNKANFANDVSKLQRIKMAIDLGILTGNETFVTNLITKIKNNFKQEYL